MGKVRVPCWFGYSSGYHVSSRGKNCKGEIVRVFVSREGSEREVVLYLTKGTNINVTTGFSDLCICTVQKQSLDKDSDLMHQSVSVTMKLNRLPSQSRPRTRTASKICKYNARDNKMWMMVTPIQHLSIMNYICARKCEKLAHADDDDNTKDNGLEID